MLATPVETLQRARDDDALVRALVAHADALDAIEIVVGLPLSMRGTDTASTADARAIAAALAAAQDRPVRLVDERLTTVSAQSALHASGRDTRRSRSVIDQVAAVILLQHALDAEAATGSPAGVIVDPTRK